ncbi:glycosyltransferase family 4 protein [Alsobacter sp. SYSU BS001988]
MSHPRIAIDVVATRFPLTGIGNYTMGIARGLSELQETDLDLFAWTGRRAKRLADFVEGFRPVKVAPGVGQDLKPAEPARGLSHQIARAKYLAVRGADVLIDAAQGTRPFDLVYALGFFPDPKLSGQAIPVIYDMSPVRFPQMHPKDRVRWFEAGLRRIETAPLFVTISQFSADEVMSMLGVAAERIRIVPPAVDEAYGLQGQEEPAPLGLQKGRYLLSVATLEPRKNFKTLVQAYSRLPEATRARWPLVLTGQLGWGDLDLPAASEALRRSGQLILTGYVDQQTLRRLYQSAAGFVYPSVYEGYGMPVSEALACGTQVAVSSGAATEEAAFGHAITVDAMDVDAWSQALARLCDASVGETPEDRDRRSRAATQYTWAEAARRTVGAFDAVLGSGRPA